MISLIDDQYVILGRNKHKRCQFIKHNKRQCKLPIIFSDRCARHVGI